VKTAVISFVIAAGILGTGACSRKQPAQVTQDQAGDVASEAAAPNDSPATVLMKDGSRYRGSLVSKNGSQLTFRGANGATRTLDSRDIQSIRFGETGNAENVRRRSSRDAESARPRAVLERVRNGLVVPSGTQISIRNNDRINAKTASAGQTFSAVVASDVLDSEGAVAIPRGAAATLVVREARAGKIHANDLGIDLASIMVRGVSHEVQTGTYYEKGRNGVGANKRTALYSGGGAAVGALIGGLVGGGKGAAIGAASGAGAGAGTQILTRGAVTVPAESLLIFTLEAPLGL